ncbi:MAG: leucyl/phenylalanyl-tRNA--protein transferase [Neisseria zoodegmatis]|uniref:leucyl/phenylalanyl-tRNA--protein transferase n=1 Tax=Neisseria zoodegmatis TaxID=326523 RepID=UPI0026F1F3F5|nr:leucyl/phenylalanyl-tRNA--protein transferase [Neisseria zoodegmatis]MDO5068609.1 leucyl/phenylalanyl-tRNA--protein transferase [Neisseria zoodegmatis]
MDIPFLHPKSKTFPDVNQAIAERDGLVAVGGDLSPERLLTAYRQGIFPWFSEGQLVCWWALSPRTVLYPEKIHIGRSLQKTLRNKPYAVTVNQCFPLVIQACAQVPRAGQDGTWITDSMQQAYIRLHEMKHAHSFECWYPDESGRLKLAGGLYGVQIGRVFFGESMFAVQPDASKIAFACAVPYLAQCGIELIDCQQNTHHLARFGSEQIDFADFSAALTRCSALPLAKEIGCGTVAVKHIP